ncbi:MAG: hypothetical protein R6V11_05670 [Ectothiorhodospiraceae bacterium]
MDKADPGDDVTLTQILDSVTMHIDKAVNRWRPDLDYFEAPAVASIRTYPGTGKKWIRIDPCIAVTAVAVKESYTSTTYDSWAVGDWLGFCGAYEKPNFNDLPYTALMVDPTGDQAYFTKGLRWPMVRVTARWGHSATPPDDIRQATIMEAARWYKRLQSTMSDTLASGELGMLLYQKSLDPDIKRILVDGRYINSVMYGF